MLTAPSLMSCPSCRIQWTTYKMHIQTLDRYMQSPDGRDKNAEPKILQHSPPKRSLATISTRVKSAVPSSSQPRLGCSMQVGCFRRRGESRWNLVTVNGRDRWRPERCDRLMMGMFNAGWLSSKSHPRLDSPRLTPAHPLSSSQTTLGKQRIATPLRWF